MLQRFFFCRRIRSSGILTYQSLFSLFLVTVAFLLAPLSAFSASKYTSHAQMMRILASVDFADEWFGENRLKVKCIGKSRKGKQIPMVVLKNPDSMDENNKRLFVICRQHGDEPATTEAMLRLIRQMTLNPTQPQQQILTTVALYIVPMTNPDGADVLNRKNAAKADLNRDWIKLSQPETQAVHSTVQDLQPNIVIDAHELGPYNRNEGDFIEVVGWGSGAHPDLISESISIQYKIIGRLRNVGLRARIERVEDTRSPRLAHRCLPLFSGMTTLLVESKQSGARAQRLEERIKLHSTAVTGVAKHLAGISDSHTSVVISSKRKITYRASRGNAGRTTKRSRH